MERPVCPICARKMIKEHASTVYMTNPPISSFRWWCQCGARGHWETDRLQRKPFTLTEIQDSLKDTKTDE